MAVVLSALFDPLVGHTKSCSREMSLQEVPVQPVTAAAAAAVLLLRPHYCCRPREIEWPPDG